MGRGLVAIFLLPWAAALEHSRPRCRVLAGGKARDWAGGACSAPGSADLEPWVRTARSCCLTQTSFKAQHPSCSLGMIVASVVGLS